MHPGAVSVAFTQRGQHRPESGAASNVFVDTCNSRALQKRMGEGFTKLYGDKLLRSTLWLEPPEARLVFLSMLAIADRDGIVDVPGMRVLSNILNLDVAYVERALAVLEAPDPDSRSPDEEGRRLLRVDGGGWRCVNYGKYREYRGSKTETTRIRVARHRANKKTKEAEPMQVYVVRRGGSHVYKVGASKNAGARLADLQTASPEPLSLVATYSGSLQLERDLHTMLKPFFMRSEWYEGEEVPSRVARYCNDVTPQRQSAEAEDRGQKQITHTDPVCDGPTIQPQPTWRTVCTLFEETHPWAAGRLSAAHQEKHCKAIWSALKGDTGAVRAACEAHAADPWVEREHAGLSHLASKLEKYAPADGVGAGPTGAEKRRLMDELDVLRAQAEDGLPVGRQIADIEGRLQS